MNWTDDAQARSEGWNVFEWGREVPRILALSNSPFTQGNTILQMNRADERALQFVQAKAAEGSAYHIEALMLLQLS